MIEPSTSFPRLTLAGLAAQPGTAGEAIRALHDPPAPSEYRSLAGRRVAFLATHGVEEVELLPPRAWLAARGATVEIVAPAPPAPGGVIEWPVVTATHILAVRFMDNAGWVAVDRRVSDTGPVDYDAVVVPGGAWNPDLLRADPAVLDFLRRADALGRVVAAICHGPLVLAEAGLVRGRRIAVFGAVRSDLANAGAILVEGGVATDGRLVTGRSPRDLPGFLLALAEALRAAPPRSESPIP